MSIEALSSRSAPLLACGPPIAAPARSSQPCGTLADGHSAGRREPSAIWKTRPDRLFWNRSPGLENFGMAVYKQRNSKNWWYKFTWNGEPIRESTKQTNKRVAEQMEAAHRAALAKGEVGIRDGRPFQRSLSSRTKSFCHLSSRASRTSQRPSSIRNGLKRLKGFLPWRGADSTQSRQARSPTSLTVFDLKTSGQQHQPDS